MTKPGSRSTLQCASSFSGSSPFSAEAGSTISSMLDDLQLDIALWIHERIYEFISPSLYPLSLRNHRGTRMCLAKRKKMEKHQLENR